MRVSVNILQRNGNATRTCSAFVKGINRSGDTAVARSDREHNMQGFDACVLWGYVTSCQNIVKQCRANGIPFVFIDMGYWRRDHQYFKVTVNERHPTKYLMDTALPGDRFRQLGLSISPWRKADGYVLVAGMSAKASWSWSIEGDTYERDTIHALSKVTKRPIIYRPKPSVTHARQIPYCRMDSRTSLAEALSGAHCVVTHHSNVGCDALLDGVPVFSKHGAASILNAYNLEYIDSPMYSDNRDQWASNLSYSQWTLGEMSTGVCWQYLKSGRLLR